MLASIRDLFKDYSKTGRLWALGLWLAITIYCVIQSLLRHRLNNYLIFENTFFNLINERSLYDLYPAVHNDANHYGPLFGVFIAPFALLPKWLGLTLWNLTNCLLLFKAIQTIEIKNKNWIYFIALPCFASSMLSQQFNPSTAAFLILTYTLRNRNGGIWSAFLIALGTLIKLYGIVGLAFFFFIKDKKSFIVYLIAWFLVLFFLPMLFSSPLYIIDSYQEWASSLVVKNASNIGSLTGDISIMGLVRNLVGAPISNGVFLVFGAILFAMPYLNIWKYGNEKFRLAILASALMFPVLFSSGSEDCTYIIAVVGAGIWYIQSEKNTFDKILLTATIIVSFDFPLMVFPDFTTLHPFAMKVISLPYFIIWLKVLAYAFLPQASTDSPPEGQVLNNGRILS